MSKKFKGPEYIPPGISKNRIQTEQQSRINVMNIAEKIGMKFDAEAIFRKYDAILAKHQDPEERKQIAIIGAAEIYKLLGLQSGFDMAGQTVIPPTEEFLANLPENKKQ